MMLYGYCKTVDGPWLDTNVEAMTVLNRMLMCLQMNVRRGRSPLKPPLAAKGQTPNSSMPEGEEGRAQASSALARGFRHVLVPD